jgi:hypothetical protein
MHSLVAFRVAAKRFDLAARCTGPSLESEGPAGKRSVTEGVEDD